ncbi:MAG: polyprenyl diphosphate synthase [bacterium]|nr:polyprenyl diphosphate synthase [bacterium]
MIFNPLPHHVAFIMDGNRRWATRVGLPKLEGHRRGLNRTREIIDECLKLEIAHCTVWGFSTENWNREETEVNYLMNLFVEYLKKHVMELDEKGVRIVHLGRKDRLPGKVVELLNEAEEQTRENSKLVLNLAIDYGGRDEILRAVKRAGKSELTEEELNSFLDTSNSPDPDLIVRTSGELRLSGFMLWQCQYAELYFTNACFPEFTVEKFHEALRDFEQRKRSIGK